MLGLTKKKTLKRAHDEVERRGARIAAMTSSHQRLEHLYAISKLLTRFRDVNRTVPEVLGLLAQTLPLRSAVFLAETAPAPTLIAWQAEGGVQDPGEQVRTQAAYNYLKGASPHLPADRDAVVLPSGLPADSGNTGGTAMKSIVLPLVVDHGKIFGVLALTGTGPFGEDGLSFANAVANQVAIAVDRQAAMVAQKAIVEESEKEQRLLAQVGAVIATSASPAATLIAIGRSTVPSFADLCIVDEVGDDGTVRRLDVMFADQNKQRDLANRMRLFCPRSHREMSSATELAQSTPVLIPHIYDPHAEPPVSTEEQRSLLGDAGIKSLLSLPLRARGRTQGVFTFGLSESDRRFSPADLRLAVEIAHRAAITIDNARLHEEALRATRARDDLLAVVSHDLKNPLSIILMSLTDLMRPLDRDERRGSRKQLARVQRSAERMNRLIHDLLDVFSIDGGSLSLEECQLEAGPVISEALDALLPLAAAKSLSLKNEVPVALPAIMADSGRFQQVLANLLSNAIKFTPEGGTITVGAKSAADEVIFSIADTGPGIDEAHLPHLFERVWQTKSTAHMGSGLGLFIVKGIVESHGGKVWAQSAVGHGTTLLFTLPIAQPAPPRSGHRPEQTRATIRRRSERSRFLGKSGVGEAFPSSEPIESSPPPHRS